MKTNNNIKRAYLLLIVILGVAGFSIQTYADKKSNEGQNRGDIEFYEPTPKKVVPPKKVTPPKKEEPNIKPKSINKILPKTGESNQLIYIGMGILFISGSVIFVLKEREVA